MFTGKINKVFIILTLIITIVLPVNVYAKIPSSNEGGSLRPEFEILSQTTGSIEAVIRFPPNPIHENDNGDIFDESIYDHPSEVGLPDLPVLRLSIELPYGSGYQVELLNKISVSSRLGENGLPATIPNRSPEVQKSIHQQTEENPDVIEINHEGTFPYSPVNLSNTYVIRGHQVGQFEFWPVIFYPNQQTVEILNEVIFRIISEQPDPNLPIERSSSLTSASFDHLLSSEIVNFNPEINPETSQTNGNEAVLIITPDAFLSELNALVNLKENQGHPVTLAPLSITGSTPESIKSFIDNAYHKWTTPPTFVILVGDVDNGSNSMPAFTGVSSGTVTDLYYGTVDGDDWIPDLFVGRLPARNTTQLKVMINNLIAYDNLTGAEGWVKKAAFLASDDANYWDFAEATQNYVIQNYTNPFGYSGTFPSSPQTGGDKLYAHTNAAGNLDVVNAVNNRRALISFTGHGSRVSWGAPGFSQDNIQNLTSTGSYSIVTSFACVTGDFSTTESFGETWLLQPNKAAVAFIGSSSSSYWGPDDILERAMMDSLYSGRDSSNIVGAFRFDGLMAVEASRPGTATAQSRYYWESYNLLGDPSLQMVIGPRESDFTLSSELSSVSICQGSEQNTTISVGQINNFSNLVELSLTALPNGLSAGFSPNPVMPSNSSTLNLSAVKNTQIGQYSVTLMGDSGNLHHELDLNLAIFDLPPETINLTTPANQSVNVSLAPTFTWEEKQSQLTYKIQIAKDDNFTQIIQSKSGLEQPSFTPISPLENNTPYYWRVQASNPCGSSPYSAAFKFTTSFAPGTCPEGTALSTLYQTKFDVKPEGWIHSGTNDSWTRSTSRSYSPNYAFFSKNQNITSLQHLTSPSITLPDTNGAPITMDFWQWFEIEASATSCFDGALLEISSDGGKTWQQIEDSQLLNTAYTGIISTAYGNPLGGKQAWCGRQDWADTRIDLTDFAGQTINLRFTQASDGNLGLEGWYLDNFSVSACEAIPDYRPRFTTSEVSASQLPGREVTVELELTNAGLQPDTYTLELTTNSWSATVKNQQTIYLSPGETTILEISVTIPENTPPGETENILVTVLSTKDPENPPAEDTATIELKAFLMSFIPILHNP